MGNTNKHMEIVSKLNNISNTEDDDDPQTFIEDESYDPDSYLDSTKIYIDVKNGRRCIITPCRILSCEMAHCKVHNTLQRV